MKYWNLFSIHNLALLSDWLEESGELLVDIYHAHSGGGSLQYFVHSIENLKDLIEAETWHTIEVMIFGEKQYALRGIADEELLGKALFQVGDGAWYTIVSLGNDFPNPIKVLNAGDSHSEMREDFLKFSGEKIGFGQNPFDLHDEEWLAKNGEKVFRLSDSKNYNWHQDYVKNPEKYKSLEKFLSL